MFRRDQTRAQVRAWFFSYSGSPRFDPGSSLDWLLRTEDEIAAYLTFQRLGRLCQDGPKHPATQVLQALGAQPHDAIRAGGQAPLITFRDPPPATRDRYNSRSSRPGGRGRPARSGRPPCRQAGA